VLDIAEQLGVADYFVLVTGLNRNHVRALVNELHVRTKALGIRHQPIEGGGLNWWVVIDFVDVVVHVMQREAREYYDMEHLFTDCSVLDWQAVETDHVEAAEA
jgi:ribosome-associated protein